jgi:SWI/SNF-related matrix-associated actin-dependent regulator of chromatin subfamily A-like protein 1
VSKIVYRVNDHYELKFGGDNFNSILTWVRMLPDAKYEAMNKRWKLPATDDNTAMLTKHGWQFIGDAYQKRIDPAKVKQFQPVGDTYKFPKGLASFQEDAIRFAISRHPASLIALPMGSGKGTLAAAYCGMVAKKVIIICPATIKEQWARELKKWAGFRSVILEGRTPYDVPFSNVQAIIVNYEIVYAWERFIRNKADYIVVDECQRIANPTTKQTKAIVSLCRKSPNRLFLSGTPAKNRPRELFTVLNLIDPNLFSDRYAFYNRYCDPKPGYQGRMTYDGSTNANELHQIMAPYMFRRSKAEILPHLPKKHKVIYSFDVQKSRSYEKAEKELLASIQKHGKDRNSLLEKTYLEAYALKSEAIFEKIDEWLEENPEEKLVIMAYHTVPVEEIYERYKAIAVKVSGSTPTKQRQSLVDQFQNDRRTRVFVGQMLAAGVGLTLTAARTMMFVELWYVPGDMAQAEDRTHRFSSTGDTVEYIYFVAAHTVEDKMMKAVEQKSQWLGEVMDGTASEYFNADDIFDVLLEQE